MFPIGCTVDNGRYQITEHLFGTPDRGVYRGRDSTTNGSVLVTLAPPQQRAREKNREIAVPRVVAVRHIGPLAGDTEARYDALVEDEPDGIRASDAQLEPESARWIALEAARIAQLAHQRGIVLRGIRPEGVYVWGTVPQLTGIAPRFETFFSSASSRDYGVPACFDHVYLAPEIIARPFGTVSAKADVFSICALLAYLLTGEHPFEGSGTMQLVAIAAGRRTPWSGDAGTGDVIDQGLAVNPMDRIDLGELIDELENM